MGARERFQRDQRIAHKEDPRSLNGAASNGHRNGQASGSSMPQESAQYEKAAQGMSDTHGTNNHSYLPTHHTPTKKTRGIQADGESGRRGVHPFKALKLILRSVSTLSAVTNILWPFVPAAIILHFLGGDHHTWTFATAYIGMVPAAALLGFAGQEFARKLPTVAGTVIESLFGSIVEIILFMVLIAKHNPNAQPGEGNLEGVLQAAILGSILANLLLCLGCVFIAGGIRHKSQTFSPHISEVGSGVMLVAGFALFIPSAFYAALKGAISQGNGQGEEGYTIERLQHDTLGISHGVAIILIVGFVVYVVYNTASHDNFLSEVLKADEENDRDRHRDLQKEKLTMTECIVAIVLALAFVSLLAVFLVEEIEYLVHYRHVPDNFLGLILVPLVEKLAEHLTAIDEAWDNQINFAIFHCVSSSVQTALFNAPLVVIVGWGLGKGFDLNFEIFMAVLVLIAIITVGQFLRDGESNWLEGALLLMVYLIIALTAWHYPNAELTTTNGVTNSAEGGAEAVKMLLKL